MRAPFTLSGSLELKDMTAEGTFTALGSTFGNVDQGGDVVEPGAFTDSLSAKQPKMLWQHNSEWVIGKWTDAAETKHGLEMEGQLLLGHDKHGNQNNPRAFEAYEALKSGAITDMSIGYVPVDWDRKDGVRHLKEIDLWEVSVVTFGMNELAKVTGVKGRVMRNETLTKRDLESFLRDAGMSRKNAKGLIAQGFHGLMPRDAEDADLTWAIESMQHLLERIPRHGKSRTQDSYRGDR